MIKSNRQFYIPLNIIIGFNLFTLLAFVTAPFDWSKGSPGIVVIYLFLNYLAIILGYKYGVKKGIKKIILKRPIFFIGSQKFINGIFIFYILTFLIKYAYLLRFSVFDISGMFSYLSIGYFDPQLGYNLSIDDERPYTVSWLVYTLISIINQGFFIFGFILWKKLKLFLKSLFILLVLIEIFYWLGRGTAFGVITLLTTLVICILVQMKIKKINKKFLFYFIILFIVGISSFSYLKTQRAGGGEIELTQFNQDSAPINLNHYIFDVVPLSMQQTYMHSISYLTQGYYHMGLAFNSTFTPTYFFGNNPASLNIAKTLGIDLYKNTYMWKVYLSNGIDDKAKWHSAYLWFANDVSFFGVPIILFLISFFTAFAYSLIIRYDDLLSKIIFVILMNMLIYLFANNTYLSQYFYSLTIIFIIWYFSRVKVLK